jgi:hypothetical protein
MTSDQLTDIFSTLCLSPNLKTLPYHQRLEIVEAACSLLNLISLYCGHPITYVECESLTLPPERTL